MSITFRNNNNNKSVWKFIGAFIQTSGRIYNTTKGGKGTRQEITYTCTCQPLVPGCLWCQQIRRFSSIFQHQQVKVPTRGNDHARVQVWYNFTSHPNFKFYQNPCLWVEGVGDSSLRVLEKNILYQSTDVFTPCISFGKMMLANNGSIY